MVQSRRLQLFGHVARSDVEQDHARALKAMIGSPPRNWKRPVGRPRQTWLRVVTSDLLPLNLGPNAAWRRAQDRDRWRRDAETETLRHHWGWPLMMMMMMMIYQKDSGCFISNSSRPPVPYSSIDAKKMKSLILHTHDCSPFFNY